jgi:hypothetical protein
MHFEYITKEILREKRKSSEMQAKYESIISWIQMFSTMIKRLQQQLTTNHLEQMENTKTITQFSDL